MDEINNRGGSVTTVAHPLSQAEGGGAIPTPPLDRRKWRVRPCDLDVVQELVRREHYSGGGSNTAVYTLGVFPESEWFGALPVAVSWYLPPTPACGKSVWPRDCQAVLALSRLVCEPSAPKNTPSFLLSNGMRFIDRQRWPILITFADDWQGHTGGIYRAAGWLECGRTKPEPTYTLNGRMVCRKAGPKTRTHAQMLGLGCVYEGRFSRRRFVHVRRDLLIEFSQIRERLTGKLVVTPDRTLDSKPAQPIAFQPTPTPSEGAENAGGGDNSTGTDGRTIIKIENSPSEANCGTSHGDQELAQNEGAESPAPERNPERKSPLPTPSETK